MSATPPLPLGLDECRKLAAGIGYPVMPQAKDLLIVWRA
jgi:pyruvate carboxylase